MSVYKRFNGKKLSAKDKNWNRGTWYVWKRLGGRTIHKPIPEAQTKQDAEIAERAIIQAAFSKKYGGIDTTTFKQFSETYEKYCRQRNTNVTAKLQYIRLLNDRFAKQLLTEISAQDCRDAQYKFQHTERKGSGILSPSSVNRIMSTLSKMFTLACEEGILDRNPMQYVKSLKEPEPRDRLLTSNEWERLWIELEKDPLMFRFVTLAVNLPLRRGQLIAITPDAIDFQQSLLFTISSKGREPRAVPLNNIAANTLRTMCAERQIPFPLTDFRKRWWKALKAAGIENFRFHDLRREMATNLRRHGVHSELIQKLYAHSDMSITRVYLSESMDELSEAVNRLDAANNQPTLESEGPPN